MKKISVIPLLICCAQLLGQSAGILQKDSLGSNTVTYRTTCFSKTDSNVVFINLHENESTSVKAATQILTAAKRYCITQLQYRNIRFITFNDGGKTFSIDPNRIFTIKGVSATLKKNSHGYGESAFIAAGKKVDKLAKNLLDSFINGKKMVVALHNNTNGEPLSIISYKSGNEAQNVKEVYMSLKQDPDDFFLTTEKDLFDFMKQKGFNIALQDDVNVQDDGSLSVYAAKNKIPYVNIEAQENHLAEQTQMVVVLLEFLKTKSL